MIDVLFINPNNSKGVYQGLSDSLSANYSHSLSVGVKWAPDSGCSLELDRSKSTTIEKSIGDIASVNASMGETIFRHIEPLEL